MNQPKKPIENQPEPKEYGATDAIFDFQARFEGVEKLRVNTFTNSNYASLDDVMNKAQPLLTDLKLAVFYVTQLVPLPDGSGYATSLTCRILHIPSNTVLESTMLLPDNEQGAQVVGGFMTYWRRYLFCGMTNIVETSDDDGNATMPITPAVVQITEKQHSQILDFAEATNTTIGQQDENGNFPPGTLMHHIQTTMQVTDIVHLTTRQATVIIKMLQTKHKRQQGE